MTFEEYLSGKKIDAMAFEQAEKELVNEWRQGFDQMHPKSFTAQKLFLINGIRRRFPLKIEQVNQELADAKPTTTATPAKPKPIMRPKIN
ncbi:hypothetical protein SanaruYs_38360 [Chryseotalea sanaruensis]|uniref:Uncharacterized protein n=1 Tax=Chryseotalea sanaruensis TaxID=2482724 RepID=A0A401UFA2_9BACT|nr:hypothetical protein [Chryseotalea sanaruensis]GCC53591.1 hypothetical protein SanaruYs_38360 [Chryseotalea sanaruensis]